MAGIRTWRGYHHHVVLIPGIGPGHSYPFFGLAMQLLTCNRGVKVTILAHELQVEEIQNDVTYKHIGPEFRAAIDGAAGNNIDIVAVKDTPCDGTLEGFIVCLHESSEAKLVAAFAACLSPLMTRMSDSNGGISEDESLPPPPCCIVSDMLVGWSQELARMFGIPRYVLHTQAAANLSLMLHVPTLVADSRLPLTESNQSELIEFPGMKLHPSDLPKDLHGSELITFSYEMFLRTSRRAAEAPVVLINTFCELEAHVLDALDDLRSHTAPPGQVPKVIPVGPLLLPVASSAPETVTAPEDEEEERIIQWLDTKPAGSVLYIAFGTVGRVGKEQMEEIALGLEASEQSFLWSAGLGQLPFGAGRSPTLSACLPPGFEERTREKGKIVTIWVPQLRILSHPACGAFLSHCGWNSSLESIYAGVPMLTWPHRAEQKMNNRFLVDIAKVAVELKEARPYFITRDEVERVVRLVLQQNAESQLMRSRVGELKQHAVRHASSSTGLDAFFAELTKIDTQ